MITRYKFIIIITTSILLFGCTPVSELKPSTVKPPIITSASSLDYGYPPQRYKEKIKRYFSNKLSRGAISKYTFSKPHRAFKRKGLAYGGTVSWRGWLVDVDISTPSRTGRIYSSKPYMVLFKGSVIVEDILGRNHKLLTRVGR